MLRLGLITINEHKAGRATSKIGGVMKAILRGVQQFDECCVPRMLGRFLLIHKLQRSFWKLKVEDIREERSILIDSFSVLE